MDRCREFLCTFLAADCRLQTAAFMNLAHNLEASAQFFPSHPAVREKDRETSYGELNEMANRQDTKRIPRGS
jgi:hypothetical protein